MSTINIQNVNNYNEFNQNSLKVIQRDGVTY